MTAIFSFIGTEFDAENQKNEAMQRIFDNQPFSQSDIERIKFERAELKRQIDELENRCEGVEQETWSSEIAISKEHEEVSQNLKYLFAGLIYSYSLK